MLRVIRGDIPSLPAGKSRLSWRSTGSCSTTAPYVVCSSTDCRLQGNVENFHRCTNTCSQSSCMVRSTVILKGTRSTSDSQENHFHQRLLNHLPLDLSLRLAEFERKQLNFETFKYCSLESSRYYISCTAQLIYFLKYLC